MAARYRELPPDLRASRRTARQEDRRRRGRRPARRSDLARAHAQPAFAPAGPQSFWPPDGPSVELDRASEPFHQADPAAAGDGEMRAAATPDEGSTRPDHAVLENRPLFMGKLFRFYARRGVGWWYWPCGHQPRPPESKDRRSATTRRGNRLGGARDSCGASLSFERYGSRCCEGAGELREDGAVGVKPDPFKTTDAKRR